MIFVHFISWLDSFPHSNPTYYNLLYFFPNLPLYETLQHSIHIPILTLPIRSIQIPLTIVAERRRFWVRSPPTQHNPEKLDQPAMRSFPSSRNVLWGPTPTHHHHHHHHHQHDYTIIIPHLSTSIHSTHFLYFSYFTSFHPILHYIPAPQLQRSEPESGVVGTELPKAEWITILYLFGS